jgi:hypothetical protein
MAVNCKTKRNFLRTFTRLNCKTKRNFLRTFTRANWRYFCTVAFWDNQTVNALFMHALYNK